MFLDIFKKKRCYSKTRKTESIEVNGVTYEVLEMNIGERMELAQYAKENKGNDLLIVSKTVSKTCAQFHGEDPVTLSMEVAPSCLKALSEKAFEMAGMTDEAQEEIEKKSESDQS